MKIGFYHKRQKVSAKVLYSDSVQDIIFIFPDSNLGELGWSIFLQRKNNKWTTTSFIKEKYPNTYFNIIAELESFDNKNIGKAQDDESSKAGFV